jgi:hypothetical protein
MLTLSLLAGLALAVLAGCSTLAEKQGEWIFQPSDRSWSGGIAAAEGERDQLKIKAPMQVMQHTDHEPSSRAKRGDPCSQEVMDGRATLAMTIYNTNAVGQSLYREALA